MDQQSQETLARLLDEWTQGLDQLAAAIRDLLREIAVGSRRGANIKKEQGQRLRDKVVDIAGQLAGLGETYLALSSITREMAGITAEEAAATCQGDGNE